MRRTTPIRIGVPAVALVLACGGDVPGVGEQPGVGASSTSSAGTNESGAAERWGIEEVMRIGAMDGSGPAVFGRIDAIEVDLDGNVLVFDGLAQELRVFTSDGQHHLSHGRAGEGPGEFRRVLGLAIAPDGDVWIVDSRNATYTVLARDGSYESFPRASRIGGGAWVAGFDEDGRLYEYATERQAERVRYLMLELDTAGEVVGELAIPGIDVPRPDFGGGGVSTSLPFAPEPLRAWDRRGRVWQAVSSEYRIANIALGGDTIVVASRSAEPTPLTGAQRDSVDSAVRRVEQVLMGQTVDPSFLPTTVPPLRWFSADDEDRLWVCASGVDPCSELDVFDSAGSYLATAELPGRVLDAPRPVVRGGRFHAAVEGQLGVPQVFVGRIVRPEE